MPLLSHRGVSKFAEKFDRLTNHFDLIVRLDYYGKKVGRLVGWNVSLRCKTVDWLKAVEDAVLNEFTEGSRGKVLSLISDNGCHLHHALF